MKHAIIFGGIFVLATSAVMAQRPTAPATTVTVENCNVGMVQQGESKLAAQEAGAVMEIMVREGQEVPAGMILARIDDKQSQKQLENAKAEHLAAAKKAEGDIEVRHATAAAEKDKYAYLKMTEANQKSAGTITDVELKEKKFEWLRDQLAIEQATKQQVIDGLTADAKKADEGVKRRQVVSPIDGIVQAIAPHVGEWVKPGDPVIRIIRMDRLRVDGTLNTKEYNPWDVTDQPVVVQATFARGRTAQFKGKIVYVDPVVQQDGGYMVRAEVDNFKENGQWVLRPGMPDTTMTIQLRPAANGMQAGSR